MGPPSQGAIRNRQIQREALQRHPPRGSGHGGCSDENILETGFGHHHRCGTSLIDHHVIRQSQKLRWPGVRWAEVSFRERPGQVLFLRIVPASRMVLSMIWATSSLPRQNGPEKMLLAREVYQHFHGK